MYILQPGTKETLFSLLDLIRPEYEETEKIEALRRGYEALRLHELPLFFALFVFDAALIDIKTGIKLKEVALNKKHWFPLILERINLVGVDGLKPLMEFIKPYEEDSHVKNTQGNEGSKKQQTIIKQ
jgi:hypothetical protein